MGCIQLGSTHFVDERLRMIFNLTAAGASAYINIDATATPDEPWEWFLDRDDLDSLPVGFSETQNLEVAVSGLLTVGGTGLPNTTESLTAVESSSDTWRIVSHQASITVLGKQYTDIVVVDRDTLGVDPQTGESVPVTIRYFVARGIGFVKAENLLSFLTAPLHWELADTNLTQ